MRSALRSSSCADAHHRDEEPQVGRERLLARQEEERAVLDGVGELVDHVVGLDHALGRGEVAVEQRLGAARDRLGGERGEADHVDPQLVEVLVERLPRALDRRLFRHWCNRHDASTCLDGGIG